MARHAARSRRNRTRHASASPRVCNGREQHPLHAGPTRSRNVCRRQGPLGRFQERRAVERPQGAGDRDGHQRSRRCAGAARARRAGHDDPAQQDACCKPERSAERLRNLLGRNPVRRLRPARHLVSLSSAKALEECGFNTWLGEDETGFQMMYLRRGGGYYFNVGCSELIISGDIGLLQYADIETFVPEGARLRDGTIVPAELLVLATGYKNQQETVRRYLGDAIADRVGPVWGFDAGGELCNMWRRTAQPGLWFTAGSLAQCRIFSRYLALQIKALEEGLRQ